MQQRERNLVLRVSDEELAMAHAVANADDMPISAVVRRFLRDTYAARFGDTTPPRPRLKHAKK